MFDDIYPHSVYHNTGEAYKFPSKFYTSSCMEPSPGIYNQQFFCELERKLPPLTDEMGPLMLATNNKFLEQETRNAAYNHQFSVMMQDRKFLRIIRLVRVEMLYLLGANPELDVPSQMTSGATTTCSSGNTPVHRWLEPEITDDLLTFVKDHYISEEYCFPMKSFSINNFAKGSHVPKNNKTNRVILIPPVCNVTYERMLGLQIGERLKRRGISINASAPLHQLLAFFGSQVDGINTDDLANASNSITTSLVKAILPVDWFEALDAARCKSYTLPTMVDGKTTHTAYHSHMFMGNGCGFCFELETAIFAAIIKVAYAIAKVPTEVSYCDIHVYGDDLIYWSSATAEVRGIMRACGFTTHVDKSFSSGYFRESCGGDFLNGLYVRPIHLKSRLESDRERVIFLNQITRRRRLNPSSYTSVIHMVYCKVLSSFDDQRNIFFGPEYMGDSVLQCPPFVDFKPPAANRYGVSRIKIWTSTPKNVECFESFGYSFPFECLMQLASNGLLRDLGKRSVDLLTGRSLLGVSGYNKNGYPMVPEPGTTYEDTVSKTLYFEVSGQVDETDPVVSVFILIGQRHNHSFPLDNLPIFNERKDHCRRMAYKYSKLRAERAPQEAGETIDYLSDLSFMI